MKRIVFVLALIFLLIGCDNKQSEPIDNINRAELLLIHNKERAINSIPQLEYSSILEQHAQKWAESMALRNGLIHSHLSIAGTDFMIIGENIAMGYPEIDSVMKGWMDSPGHRRNILNCKFTHAGFGYAKTSDDSPYWCAQFGGN